MHEQKHIAYCYLTVTFFIWGSLYVIGRHVMDTIPPCAVSFFRYLIAVPPIMILLKSRGLLKISNNDRIVFITVGVGYFLTNLFQLIGTWLSGASLGALINSTNPLFIILFSVIILKEKITLRTVVGISVSISGIIIILKANFENNIFIGSIVSTISVIVWSLLSIYMRKISIKYSSLSIVGWGMGVALVCSLPTAVAEYIYNPWVPDFISIISIIYIGLVCTFAAHYLWNKSLSMIDANICSVFYPIQPLTASIFGILFLGEYGGILFWIGFILIIIGMVCCLSKK